MKEQGPPRTDINILNKQVIEPLHCIQGANEKLEKALMTAHAQGRPVHAAAVPADSAGQGVCCCCVNPVTNQYMMTNGSHNTGGHCITILAPPLDASTTHHGSRLHQLELVQ